MAAVVMILGVLLWGTRSRDDAFDGALLETGSGEQQRLELADGSKITLAALTRLRLVHVGRRDVRLVLERGSVEAEVTHLERRAFTVGAGGVDVGVTGTHFVVSIDEDDREVHVGVSDGRVRLTSEDGSFAPRFLSAGETWSTAVARVAAPAPSDTALQDAAVASPPSRPAQPSKPTLPRGFADMYNEGRYTEAYSSVRGNAYANLVSTLGSRDLYMLASAARLSGHAQDAATAFDALRSRFRSDPHASFAALELGRLRLNELDDAQGAKEAFDDAIVLDPATPLREDIEAWRVRALDRLGVRATCEEARERYLATYPAGLHASSVNRACR